ncbi:MAG: rod shape-determining protein MreD [Deltaproteobacteria bacterium]|nr:rod shape-determining protein MreD [Deltaproteobacteria bacterium]
MLTIGSQTSLKPRDVVVLMILGLALTALSYLPTVVRLLGWASPEWSLILVLFLAFRSEFTMAGLAAFALGCFQDALSVSPEGLESLALLLIVLVITFGSEIMKVNNVLVILLVVLASLVKNTLFIPGFLSVMGLYRPVSSVILFDCLVKAIVTGLVALPVLSFLDLVTRKAETPA